MSASSNKKLIQISKTQKKVSSNGLKNILNAIGRRIFNKTERNEVEYGQTLSKKRRKNCILKSVSSLSCPENDNGFLLHSPYHINFKFSEEDSHFRGNVVNFQKINIEESCCEKCFYTLKKGDSLSKFSISSDSACDVSSESSCDNLDCKYRKTIPKSRARLKKKSKSAGDFSKNINSVESFIRIHNENFRNEIATHTLDSSAISGEDYNLLPEWTNEEPAYEFLDSKLEDYKPYVNDSEFDILVTKAGYKVVEPSYENLKLIENFYEIPQCKEFYAESSNNKPAEKTKDKVQLNKTYDEVIESLKLWHLSSRYLEGYGEKIENEFNHCVECYESLENDFNNDIEEFCC